MPHLAGVQVVLAGEEVIHLWKKAREVPASCTPWCVDQETSLTCRTVRTEPSSGE